MQLDKEEIKILKYKTRKKNTYYCSIRKINFLLFIIVLYLISSLNIGYCSILKRTIKINLKNEDHKNTSNQDDNLWGSNNIVDSSDTSSQMISHVQQNSLVLDESGNKFVNSKNADKAPNSIKSADTNKNNNTTKSLDNNTSNNQKNSSDTGLKNDNQNIKTPEENGNIKSNNTSNISKSENSKDSSIVKNTPSPSAQSSNTKKEPCENPVDVSSIMCNDVYISNVDNPCNEGFFFHKCKGECIKKC